jgi:transposase
MKPTLGYPSRTQAVRALIAQGLSEQEIADKIGISKNNVQCLQYDLTSRVRHRRSGAHKGPMRTVHMSKADLEILTPQARKRGIHVAELARRLLCVIADDGLADAILDDAAPRDGSA